MASMNLVVLEGRVCFEPELRYTGSGTPVATLRIATDEYRGKDDATGEKKIETEFHDVVLWAGKAEFAAEYIHKGDAVLVQGKLHSRTYKDREGNERKVVEVKADVIQIASKYRPASSDAPSTGSPGSNPGSTTNDPDDDLPF